jgi:hypothetical protein
MASPVPNDDNDNSTEQVASDVSSAQANTDKPGRREKNPLGFFSSYTYRLSLYMITPDAYDAFIQTGRKQINALTNAEGNPITGALLIAQSGGINNTDSRRAPGFDLDYYIDNLTIKTFTSAKASLSESNSTEVKFQIIEPYGFSFITKLKNASAAIQGYSDQLANANHLLQNPSKQFFILGIKFLGYDENGKLMSGSNIYEGNQLDPESTSQGIFDRYYDIMITGIKFKLDGNATTYNVSAVSIAPKEAFGVKRGVIKTNTNIEAANVEEALKELVNRQTKLEEDLLKQNPSPIRYANKYVIEYVGEGVDKIKEAKIVTPEDYLTYTWSGSQSQNVTESNIAGEANSNPDNQRRQIIFKNDTPLVQAISDVIKQSEYLRNALKVIYNNTPQPDPNGNGETEGVPNNPQSIAWFNLSAIVSDAKWDDKRKEFAYTITYQIRKYDTPVIQSVYANNGSVYYGPHKRYDFWYTGKNSEILSYEQNLDNAYFNVVLADLPEGNEQQTDGDSTASTAAYGTPTGQSNLGAINEQGKAAQNNYLTSLFDPGSFATAKITILGDPDYLAQDSPGSVEELYNKFYGDDGFTINPSGGQVFIEINFKEAIDLDYTKGYLEINDRILFWKYPDEIADKIKGVSYQIIDVNSTFQGGTFKQVLNCVINTFGEYKNERPGEREDTSPTGTGANAGTGLPQDPLIPVVPATTNQETPAGRNENSED